MRDTSVRLDYLSDLIQEEANNFSLNGDESVFAMAEKELSKDFPNCTEEEKISIIRLCLKMASAKVDEKSELVITAPESFNLKSKRIKIALSSLIINAQKSVLLTGYSVSEYINSLIDVIVDKSRQGIYFTLYINGLEEQQNKLDKLLAYKGRYLKIFNYQKKDDDKMSAMHAKIIVVDGCRSLISSANLSYHGLEGNIEMGILLESTQKAEQIIKLFDELTRMKIFIQA